jgi:hypothetical protein
MLTLRRPCLRERMAIRAAPRRAYVPFARASARVGSWRYARSRTLAGVEFSADIVGGDRICVSRSGLFEEPAGAALGHRHMTISRIAAVRVLAWILTVVAVVVLGSLHGHSRALAMWVILGVIGVLVVARLLMFLSRAR